MDRLIVAGSLFRQGVPPHANWPVAVDTTVREKAIGHPTDARLTHRAIEKLVESGQTRGR